MWYKYSFPALACQGIDADCSRASDCSNNYFVCDNCCRQQWFESKIITFKSDAVTRAEAQRRLKFKEELPLHKELKKQQKEFCNRGGIIKPILLESEQPTICWDQSGKTIRAVRCNHS